MEENVTGSGAPMGKRPSESGIEVDYKTKAGTAWSHSYLNQKPWHPLSYPNQRRKWIAEQSHANRSRRAEEVAREFAQEQEFFRQTSLFSKKEKEKVEMMQAVSFMYVRPPGYNAESAKAAEDADEQKRMDPNSSAQDAVNVASSSIPDAKTAGGPNKPRPKDVFGRPLPTENEFDALKNAPRLETGVPVRIKPFAVEIRNVRCVRCGTFGHQSGDRECPLKDAIMPNEESRLKRDDPLTAIKAQTESAEPLKWELKQKPGLSPPRGGFKPDDPNQQIVAEDEEIFDEYGGFLSGGDIPSLLFNYSSSKSKKKSKDKKKHKHHYRADKDSKNYNSDNRSSPYLDSDSDEDKTMRLNRNHKKHNHSNYSSDDEDEIERKNKSYSKSKEKKKKDSDSSSSDSYDRRMESRREETRNKQTRKHRKRCYSDSSTSDSYDKELERRRLGKTSNKHESRYVPEDCEVKANREGKRDSQRKHIKHHKKQHSDSETDREKRSLSRHRKQISKASDDSGSEFNHRHREQETDHRRRRHHHHRRHSVSEYASG